MEQRRLRLGDILDDYCPRERRVTNHAVVAMIDEDVKQTRCTTCDAEHPYKGGREPRRRKKDAPAALYREVLAGMSEPDAASAEGPSADAPAEPATEPAEEAVAFELSDESNGNGEAAEEAVPPTVEEQTDDGDPPLLEEGPVHRRLIRATLPRPEGAPAKDARPLPEFTMRHNGGRGHFRGGQHRGHSSGSGNGNRPHGRRFSGGGHNSGMGNRGPSGRGGFGGKKRSR